MLGLKGGALRHFRWGECAMVFQSALNALNPVLRISEHFSDTARAHGFKAGQGADALRKRSMDLLARVRLDPERVWRAFPHELSGGMRQRVLIALALLLEPQLLILDEPTTALDILTQRSIMDVLKELRSQLGFSMLFISHDLALAAELADRVATMYAGRIIEIGDVRTVFNNPYHPYTIGLIKAVPTLTGDKSELTSVPGSPPDLINLPTGCKFHPRCPLADERCRTRGHGVDRSGARPSRGLLALDRCPRGLEDLQGRVDDDGCITDHARTRQPDLRRQGSIHHGRRRRHQP